MERMILGGLGGGRLYEEFGFRISEIRYESRTILVEHGPVEKFSWLGLLGSLRPFTRHVLKDLRNRVDEAINILL